MRRLITAAVMALLLCAPCRAEPLCEKYLLAGDIAEGEKALEKHLKDKPDDDEARFGLAVIQFLRGAENLGKGLHRYGLRTTLITQVVRPLATIIPENPKPEKLTYADSRKLIQALVDTFDRVGATLDKIKDEKVKLPLPLGKIKIDIFGQGKPVSAALLLGALEMNDQSKAASQFVVGFDRADVSWLRGYCHLLAGLGEFVLAMDYEELFECTAHRFFANADTPHKFLLEEKELDAKDVEKRGDDPAKWFKEISDAVTLLHLTVALPVKEPERMKSVLAHLEGMVAHGKQMWTHIRAESDDDLEWIPGPKQKGALNIPVTAEMMINWLETLDEVDLLLKGKTLLPFWRGTKADVGVNLRKALASTSNKRIDVVRWVQGTAATPYLEKGKITGLADPQRIARLDQAFGGFNFFGFAFWFN